MKYDDDRFIEVAREKGFLTDEALEGARRRREELRQMGVQDEMPIGEFLVDRGTLTREQHDEIVRVLMAHRIPGYELTEALPATQFGSRYLARKKIGGEVVEIRLLEADQRDETFAKRFGREATVAIRVQHPNVLRALDVGRAGDLYYFATEHVKGRTAKDLLAERRVLEEKECLKILEGIGQALEALHRAGVVHRDIRPENILITDQGHVKLTGLGMIKSTAPEAAALTMPGMMVGVLDYVSPEQGAGDRPVDIRSDIYSLGATVYHLATGSPPWKGVSVSDRASGRVPHPRQRNPQLSDGFCRVLLKALAGPPDLRYQLPGELVADVQRILRGAVATGRPVTRLAPPRRETKKTLRRPSVWPWVLLLSLALAAAAVAAWWLFLRSP